MRHPTRAKSNQTLAMIWHIVATVLIGLGFAWEAYGLWGHFMLRNRKPSHSVVE